MTIPEHIRAQAETIATRHAITPIPVLYMLTELKLQSEVVELFAAMADQGYGSERIVAAAQALTGTTRYSSWIRDTDL